MIKKNSFRSSKAAVIAVVFLLVFSTVMAVLPVAKAAGAITLSSTTATPGGSVTITGSGFGMQKPLGIGFGAEVNVINESLPKFTGPWDVDVGPFLTNTAQVPINPGSYVAYINITSTLWMLADQDEGNGTFSSPWGAYGTINYVTGLITNFQPEPMTSDPYYAMIANYTTYEYDVTPAAGVTTFATGTFQATITVPDVYNGDYAITAIDPQGNTATATLTVTGGEDPPETGWPYDWPMYGHDPQRSGYTESPSPNTNQTLWTTPPIPLGYLQNPVVADGRLYVGSVVQNFYCFDAVFGTQLWRASLSGVLYSNPAVADGRVYVGTNNNVTYCLDALTGEKIWNYTTGGWVGCRLAIVDGRLYMGSDDTNFYCLDAATGTQIWNYTAPGGRIIGLSVVDGRVYFGSVDDHMVHCLNAADGAFVWNYTTDGDVWAGPTVWDGKVYVGSNDTNVYCLDATSGTKIWNYSTGHEIYCYATVTDGKVYVSSFDTNIYCLDATTGTKIWNYSTGAQVYAAPNVADGKVYATNMGGKVFCLNADTGAEIWSYTTNDAIFYGGAIVANGVVYVAEYQGDRRVIAFCEGIENVVPEGLTIGVMLLLSTIAVIVSVRYFRKRPKWENW